MQFIYSFAPSFGAILASPGYAILLLCIFLLIRFLRLTSFDAQPQITLRLKGHNNSGSGGGKRRKSSSTNGDESDANDNGIGNGRIDEDAEGNSNGDCWAAVDPKNADLIDLAEVLEQCSILKKLYIPPPIWGRNGHIQTAVYGVLGHQSLRRTFDKRHSLRLPDGTTATFDVFEPVAPHETGGDFTLVFCPGIANCSESNYIRTCVHLIQENGYRSAVLNHLGVLRDVQLTSQRIFSYGGNGEMEAMFRMLASLYPHTRFIGVGFSMGANVLTNCLARLEPASVRQRVILGVSVCQGYSATNGAAMLMDWEAGRRFYNYIITENVKRLLRRNYAMVVQPHVRSGLVNEQQLWAATSLHWLDECYSRRVQGFASLEDYYEHSSCLPRIKDIQVPMIFVNSLDDPLVPEPLWTPVRDICQNHRRHAFVLLKHGGHLGFLEGSSPLSPRSVTWLDRFILQLAQAATAMAAEQSPPPTTTTIATQEKAVMKTV